MAEKKPPPGENGGFEGQFKFVCAIIVAVALRLLTEKIARIIQYHWVLSLFTAAISLFFLGFYCYAAFQNWKRKKETDPRPTSPSTGAIYLGKESETGEKIYLQESSRTMHTQVIGTTNAGKTASVVLPWAVSDIKEGRGFIMVDGKSDLALLNNLYGYATQYGRKDDFLIFSLVKPNISSTFNPLFQGSPEVLTERMFSALSFTEEYYKNIQFLALRTLIESIQSKGLTPTTAMVRDMLRDKEYLTRFATALPAPLQRDIQAMTVDKNETFSEKYSGLVTQLSHFSQGAVVPLFNPEKPDIILSECLKQNKIVYFQLPTMQYPFLGQATGKLVLQCLQSAISELQTEGGKLKNLYSVYLDDFNDYIYPGFVSLLNKSRSANVGVVFSHQSLGDLEKVSQDFKQSVLINTNVKIIMRSNDPPTAEHFSQMIGTLAGEKKTSRRSKGFLWDQDTGEQSVRTVEEYVIHPNVFKSGLGLGQGVTIIPHRDGRVVKKIQFQALEDYPGEVQIPIKEHPVVRELPRLPSVPDENSKRPNKLVA